MDPAATLLAAAAAFGGITAFRRWREGALRGSGGARNAWQLAYPGDQVHDSIVSEDGRAALVQTDWGCGVIFRRGAVARRLDTAAIEVAADGLNIDLRDDAVTVKLTPADAAHWHEKINDVQAAGR